MATYSYVRVSTVRQSEEGESLDVQQRTISGYALMRGMELDRVFVERAVSGSVPLTDRPQGGALLDVVRPGDAIVTPNREVAPSIWSTSAATSRRTASVSSCSRSSAPWLRPSGTAPGSGSRR